MCYIKYIHSFMLWMSSAVLRAPTPPTAEFLGPPAPSSPSLSQQNTEEPFLLLIYCVNDYIPHWLAIVSLMDLIKLGLITAGDI